MERGTEEKRGGRGEEGRGEDRRRGEGRGAAAASLMPG